MELETKIKDRSARIAVIGLGYVGLPLAVAVAKSGFSVVGIDQDPVRVDLVNSGSSPILDVDDKDIAEVVELNRLEATTDRGALASADVIVICVPTPLKGDLPDTSHIEAAAKSIAAHLTAGSLVILESTTYPGTTEELLLNLLDESKLKAGIDYYLGFSPERIDPGNQKYQLKDVPKIVGGINETSTALMERFYSAFIERTVRVSAPRVAEMAKLLENTYRHVNIALVNEIAILCHELGIDVWEVIEAASTKPFGFQPFYPGPGWGGHCIPVDPSYLSWRVRQMGATARFVELAREFNDRMPDYVVQRISEALNDKGRSVKGAEVFLIGVTYKKDVADVRESPALEILERLVKAGARVSFHDPYINAVQIKGSQIDSEPIEAGLERADILVVITDHSVIDWSEIARSNRLVLDTRNVMKGLSGQIVKL